MIGSMIGVGAIFLNLLCREEAGFSHPLGFELWKMKNKRKKIIGKLFTLFINIYFIFWVFWVLMLIALRNSCLDVEWKITHLLLGSIGFLLSTKFWLDSCEIK